MSAVAAAVGAGLGAIGIGVGAWQASREEKRKRERADAFNKQLRENQPEIDQNAANIGDKYTSQFDQLGQNAQNRGSARVGGTDISTWEQGQMRQQQGQLIDQLGKRARGETESAAEIALRTARDQNINAARSAAISAEGLSPAAALRAQLGAQSQSNIAATQQMGQMRAQEQAAAEGQLAEVLSGARSQDIGLAQAQAGLDQQTLMANLQSEQGQREMNDRMTAYYMSQGFPRDQAQQQANMQMQDLIQKTYIAREGIAAGVMTGSNQSQGWGSALMGAGANMLGSAAAAYGGGGGK